MNLQTALTAQSSPKDTGETWNSHEPSNQMSDQSPEQKTTSLAAKESDETLVKAFALTSQTRSVAPLLNIAKNGPHERRIRLLNLLNSNREKMGLSDEQILYVVNHILHWDPGLQWTLPAGIQDAYPNWNPESQAGRFDHASSQ